MAEEEVQETETDAEGIVGEEDKDKGSKKTIIIVVVMALVLLIGVGAAYFTGALDGLLGKDKTEVEQVEHGEEGGHGEKSGGHGEAAEGEHGEGVASGPQFMVIPDIIVNLNSTTKQPRFLKLKVQIEVASATDLEKVQAVAPRVIDHFQTYLRELRVEDLKGSAGIYRLRQELVRRVNAAAYPVKVTDVLFQEILIQ
ncbi:MAG: flagellar basal body protein FliL [Micavibrio sp.]|nr:flagellar basal body protein FliL [Micavibrio sp.]|tara:strand:- start:1434 stop:2027 length:594 start_codon:yes stop_codon:yes gene_type:complete